jgi:hypothetical protein
VDSVTIIDSASGHLGASFRRRRHGPEALLVDAFLDRKELQIPRGCRAVAFREPRLESGCPDLVLVVWHPRTAQRWSSERAALSPEDLRVLHFVLRNGPSEMETLRTVTGRNVAASVERLEAAGTVRRMKDRWAARPLSQAFAVRAIVAIEAKMKEWDAVLQQAWLNTWFASASFVLVPQGRRSKGLLTRAERMGIGVLTDEMGKVDLRRCSTGAQPVSYASWLFNEWVWRAEWR